jgi:hypothetical protein
MFVVVVHDSCDNDIHAAIGPFQTEQEATDKAKELAIEEDENGALFTVVRVQSME